MNKLETKANLAEAGHAVAKEMEIPRPRGMSPGLQSEPEPLGAGDTRDEGVQPT